MNSFAASETPPHTGHFASSNVKVPARTASVISLWVEPPKGGAPQSSMNTITPRDQQSQAHVYDLASTSGAM